MKILLWFALFSAVFILGVRYIETHSIFFPMQEMNMTPKDSGIDFEDIYFETSDNVKLNGWFIPRQGARLTLLFAHGNAGNISHRIDKISILHNIYINIFIFDYRGYGKSLGKPSEPGLYRDIEAAYEYLTKNKGIKADNIVLYGESIGGSVAIDLAAKANVAALITEDAMTSVRDMAKMAYPFFPRFIFSSKFNSLSKIEKVQCAKLIIHSLDDEIVPFHLGEKLYNAASQPKTLHKIRGGHNTAFLDSEKEYKQGIQSFITSLPR